MARRTKDWNEGLAKNLQDSGFAKQFIKAALLDERLLRQDGLVAFMPMLITL
ncbi:MAG: hypothetical protein HY203_01135 [Nitrospirae bacterium]|nr:hypothetical protein [Nitrospirota bacterium]